MSDPNIVAGPTPAEFYRGAAMPHLIGSEEFAELADRVAALEKKASSPVVVVDENVPQGMYYGMPDPSGPLTIEEGFARLPLRVRLRIVGSMFSPKNLRKGLR